ncbi:MAG: thioredoxin [Deltaproteobacteria bacterium]|nr:thioredoxin [Deltaproteobacteria bacterium]
MRFASTILLSAALLFGCTREPAPPPAASAQAAPTPPVPTQPEGHLRLIPAPDYPNAAMVIADQLAQSESAHRRLLVYVGAPWCEPCQHFHKAAEAGELDAVFPDLDLLVFDSERDNVRLFQAGYVSKYIPLFVVPNPDGRSSGKHIEGGIKGDGAVKQLTPRLKELLGN